jgi:hypothetical protein
VTFIDTSMLAVFLGWWWLSTRMRTLDRALGRKGAKP